MRTTLLVLLILYSIISIPNISLQASELEFDGDSAFSYLEAQCDFGTRPPGSENLTQCRGYIVDILRSFGWDVILQNFTYRDVDCANIVAHDSVSQNVSIILGAHYDTRPLADHDPNPENRDESVMGANDGASGTAVLMELARILPTQIRNKIELVFFDAEDSGSINGWQWIVGSNYYVDQMSPEIIANITMMILVDMVGDTNLRLQRELYSTRDLQNEVWSIAAHLGYDAIFQDSNGGYIIDDHHPFLNVGIPSLDIIHHDPFPATWHTIHDIPDRCNPDSLESVGRVLEYFITNTTGWTGEYEPNFVFPIELTLIGIFSVVAIITIAVYIRRK